MRVHVENAGVHGAWNFRLGRELIHGGFARTKAIMSVPGLNADVGRAPCHVAKVPGRDNPCRTESPYQGYPATRERINEVSFKFR